MYGLISLTRKYLLPHLQPPTRTSFEETSHSLSEQFDAAQQLLDELRLRPRFPLPNSRILFELQDERLLRVRRRPTMDRLESIADVRGKIIPGRLRNHAADYTFPQGILFRPVFRLRKI